MQPCLFGVGLFELRSPASVAALVQQQPFEIDDNIFVQFIHHNNRNNHRAIQGARRGWIMVLGIPFDYRNDYDISNAVAAFGKFHHWHLDDVFKERTMIYITFDSPASVPRDIVFGNYANIGDLKETWTAPCYVMGAEFADALPADEDQMPPDGNPHPLPGNLVVQNNMVVLPPFPQLGWNNAPLHGEQVQHDQPGNNVQMHQEEVPQEQPVEELVDDSIVVGLSAAEGAQADMEEGEVNQPMMEGAALLQQMLGQNHVLHVGLVHIGPMLPPQMIIERLISVALPHSFFSAIPKPLSYPPFKSVFLSEPELLFKGSLSYSLGLMHAQVARRPRVWCQEGDSATPIQSVSQKKRGRPRKAEPAVVDTAYRRSTRSCTKRDGHMPVSMSDTVTRPRKKVKVQRKKAGEEMTDVPDTTAETDQESQQQHNADNTVQIPPETLVHIMQRVGVALGIDPDMLTEEKLNAVPKGKNGKDSPNDS
ncbi:hypothetical protein ACQ4PT_067840 [Festuca glaucescens]